jgi:hypothetical protein
LLPEERHPTLGPWVRLVEAADEGVSLVAVSIGRDVVQLCKKFGGVPFGTLGETAAASTYSITSSVSEP